MSNQAGAVERETNADNNYSFVQFIQESNPWNFLHFAVFWENISKGIATTKFLEFDTPAHQHISIENKTVNKSNLS